MEITEHRDHPFMIGSQFHPEFQSNPLQVHPLFFQLVRAAIAYEIAGAGVYTYAPAVPAVVQL